MLICPFDIFLAEINGVKHYFVCIYSQQHDINNHLSGDIYGLMITTNPKIEWLIDTKHNDYNVKIEINRKNCFVCCDKMIRMQLSDVIIKKRKRLTPKEMCAINQKVIGFQYEIHRQIQTIIDKSRMPYMENWLVETEGGKVK